MLIVSLYMSGVTYRYYSPVRFVNESNPTRCLLLIPAAVCRLDVHHSHLERKTFFSVSPGDTSPLVSRYADISSVSPLSCFMISVLYRVKGLSHEKWTKKKKKIPEKKYNLYLYSSAVLFHSGVLDSRCAALATCHLGAPAPSYSHPSWLLFHYFSPSSSLFSQISLFILHM